MSIKTALIETTAAGFLLAAGSIATAQDGGGPYVTVEHPPAVKQLGGEQFRKVDCGLLGREQGKLWLTCEFATQVDSNGQNVCDVTDKLSDNDSPKTKTNAYSIALSSALKHFATTHHDCIKQDGIQELQFLRAQDPDKFNAMSKQEKLDYVGQSLGDDWFDKATCTLQQAQHQCSSALGLGQ